MRVGVGMIKVWNGVTLGSGVNVLRGVEVKVAVRVAGGMAATVCVDAALAVCAISRLIELGSVVARGIGVGSDGAQARISVSVMNQRKYFLRYAVIDVMVQLSGIYSGFASCEITKYHSSSSRISFTLPTCPSDKRTLIPCG